MLGVPARAALASWDKPTGGLSKAWQGAFPTRGSLGSRALLCLGGIGKPWQSWLHFTARNVGKFQQSGATPPIILGVGQELRFQARQTGLSPNLTTRCFKKCKSQDRPKSSPEMQGKGSWPSPCSAGLVYTVSEVRLGLFLFTGP